MINSFVNFLLKFSLFYDLTQTKRQLLQEFRKDLQKEKSSQNPVTKRTYEDLTDVDKTIINRFKNNYRKSDNAVYLSTHGINYSYGGVYYRLQNIANMLYNNIQPANETIENEVT